VGVFLEFFKRIVRVKKKPRRGGAAADGNSDQSPQSIQNKRKKTTPSARTADRATIPTNVAPQSSLHNLNTHLLNIFIATPGNVNILIIINMVIFQHVL
jgi:hypothetical protein